MGILHAPGRSKKVLRPVPDPSRCFRSGIAPGNPREGAGITGTTRESVSITVPNRLTPVVPDVDYGNHESAWSPRFTRVHYGALGLGTVDRGVALRKHLGRPRLTPGVRRGGGGSGSDQKHPGVSPVAPRWLRLVPVGFGVISTDGHGAER